MQLITEEEVTDPSAGKRGEKGAAQAITSTRERDQYTEIKTQQLGQCMQNDMFNSEIDV